MGGGILEPFALQGCLQLGGLRFLLGPHLLRGSTPRLFTCIVLTVVLAKDHDPLAPACLVCVCVWDPPRDSHLVNMGLSLVSQMVENPPAMQETQVQSMGWEDPWRRE